jgi:hypothetical protein
MPWQRDSDYPLVRRRGRPAAWFRRHRHQIGIAALATVALAALAYPVLMDLSRWPLTVALRHAAAAPNCAAARAVGLAPAYRGQPGYYPQHDRDRDGIACEPWPGR